MKDETDHLRRVDALRGVAILLVVIFHLLGFCYTTYTFPWKGLWMDVTNPPSPSFYPFYPLTLFWTGVPLFFVISGFCIHLSFLRTQGSFSTSTFFWRRFWRIYPAYVLCLLTLVFVQRRHGVNLKDVLAHVFLVHNLSQSTIFGINVPFWSLATEAQLYLMYPIFLWLRKHHGIWGALGRVLLVTLLARIPAAWGTDWEADLQAAHWQSPIILWLDWCLGALAAELHYKQRLAACGERRLVICLGGLFCASTFFKITNTFSFTLASLFWTIVLGRYLVRRSGFPKWERLLVPAGLCSYSLYLWHFPIQRQLLGLIQKLGIQQGTVAFMVVGFLVTVPVALGVSWFLYMAIERPGITLGHRLKHACWPALPNVLFQKQKS